MRYLRSQYRRYITTSRLSNSGRLRSVVVGHEVSYITAFRQTTLFFYYMNLYLKDVNSSKLNRHLRYLIECSSALIDYHFGYPFFMGFYYESGELVDYSSVIVSENNEFQEQRGQKYRQFIVFKISFFSPWLHFRNWVHWKTRILLFYGWDSFRIGGNLLSVLNYASYFPEYKWNKIDESKIMRNNELRKWKTNDEKIWSGNDNKTKWKRQFLNLKFWLFRFSLD